MRIILVLPIFSFLFGARATSLDTRQPDAHPLDARYVTDVCAFIDTELEVPDSDGNPVDAGPIDRCMCLSQIPQFISQLSISFESLTGGEAQLLPAILTGIITVNPCTYPDNSVPKCVENACGFTCTNGFAPSPPENPTTCACIAPYTSCGGVCGIFHACPSDKATANKKRWIGSGSCTERGHGWAACGVFGGGARAWECVNTARDLESCGGCVLPLTPFSPIGQDCTALPGVADVSCLSGECVVHRCMSGYALSRDSTHCIPAQAHISRPHVAVPEDDEEYIEALRYGLEHRPLHRN